MQLEATLALQNKLMGQCKIPLRPILAVTCVDYITKLGRTQVRFQKRSRNMPNNGLSKRQR